MDRMPFAAVETNIRLEFTAWPQLTVTLPQASRLWNLPHDVCEGAMRALVASGLLECGTGGFFCRGLSRRRRARTAAVAAAGSGL